MPTFNITDPTTGRKLRVTGDSPPDSAELEQLFSAPALAQTEKQTGKIEPQQPASERQGGKFGFGDFLAGVGQVADVLTAAPTRAGLKAGLEAPVAPKPPGVPEFGGAGPFLKEAIPAALKQFLSFDPTKAPTGGEIAREQLGLSTATEGAQPRTGPTPAGAVGLGIDVLADISNIIPVRAAPKIAGKAIGKVTGKIPEAVAPSALADFLTGTTIPGRTARGFKSGAETFGKTLKRSFTSEPAPDFLKFRDIAIRNKIPVDDLPNSVQFGKESLKSRSERFARQGPEGEQLFKAFEDKTTQVNLAIRDDMARVAGGPPIKDFEAGELIRTNFDDTVSKLFDDIEVTYDSAVPAGAFIEDDAFIKLDSTLRSMQKKAKRDADFGASDEVISQGAQLFRNIENVHKGNGSYKQTLDSMRDIGKAAFKSQNPAIVSPDVKQMQKLYFALRDALTDTARFHNPTVADQLIDNNALITELVGEKNVLAKIVQNKNLSNEQVFNQLVLSGNSKKVQALTTFFGGDDLQKLKGAFMDGILRDDALTGSIGARSTANTLGKKENVAQFLFEVGEIDNFKDLLALSDRLGTPLLSSSDTGGTLQFLKQAPLRGVESGLEAFLGPVARPKESTLFPAVTSPEAFLRGPGSKAKALQVFSTQKADAEKRKQGALDRAVVQ